MLPGPKGDAGTIMHPRVGPPPPNFSFPLLDKNCKLGLELIENIGKKELNSHGGIFQSEYFRHVGGVKEGFVICITQLCIKQDFTKAIGIH